jgi:hypothetical protein
MDEVRGGGTLWALLARLFARWAEEISRGVRRLDHRDPGWRDDPGFYLKEDPG